MIVDQFLPEKMSNERKEEIISAALKTEEGRAALLKGMSWMDAPKRKAPKFDLSGDVSRYICKAEWEYPVRKRDDS